MGSIKKLSSLALITITFLISIPAAFADSFEEVPQLPGYMPCQVKGIDYACYDLEGEKALLELEALAQKLQNQSDLDAAMIVKYQELIREKDKQLELEINLNKQIVQAYTEQTEQLKKEIAEKNKFKYSPKIDLGSNNLPWIITGTVGLLAGGFVLGMVVHDL